MKQKLYHRALRDSQSGSTLGMKKRSKTFSLIWTEEKNFAAEVMLKYIFFLERQQGERENNRKREVKTQGLA